MLPTTYKSSSTYTVPPAEFKVRFPVVVSIILLPATPILTLLISAPEFASIKLEKVEIPTTLSWSSIIVVPAAESKVRLPDAVSISDEPAWPILILLIFAYPLTSRLVSIVASDKVLNVPLTITLEFADVNTKSDNAVVNVVAEAIPIKILFDFTPLENVPIPDKYAFFQVLPTVESPRLNVLSWFGNKWELISALMVKVSISLSPSVIDGPKIVADPTKVEFPLTLNPAPT